MLFVNFRLLANVIFRYTTNSSLSWSSPGPESSPLSSPGPESSPWSSPGPESRFLLRPYSWQSPILVLMSPLNYSDAW